MSEQLNEVVKSIGLEPDEAEKVLAQFDEFKAIASEWDAKAKAIVVTDDTQTEMMAQAREGRLFLKNTRIALEKTRKRLKERSLREGKAIQTIANTLKDLITPIEDYLDNQENFIEIRDAKRKRKLGIEREAKLRELGVDPDFYILGDMPDEDFDLLVTSTKESIRLKKEEAARLEKERIELKEKEDAERERVMAENEKLHKEAREREAELAKERAKVEAEQELKRKAELKAEYEARKKEIAEKKAKDAEHERELALRREKAAKEAKANTVERTDRIIGNASDMLITARKLVTNIHQSTDPECLHCGTIQGLIDKDIKLIGGFLE